MDITICRDRTNERGVVGHCLPPLLVVWHSLDVGVGRCLDLIPCLRVR